MEQRGGGAGAALRRLRVPACSSRRRWQRRGAGPSDASRDRKSPCATWGLTASSAPRHWRWGSCRPGGSLCIPLCQPKDRPQPPAATSLRCGSSAPTLPGGSCRCGGLA